MKISVINTAGAAKGEFELADDLLIKNGKGQQAVHDAVTAYMANQRLGTSKVKQIGDVHGSGKKPWRQKGTGRARAGSFASPIWRGGGIVFGPHPRDYSQSIPKKVKALAFRKVLSERLLAGELVVIDELKVTSPKTKELVALIDKVAAKKGGTLLVTDVVDNNLKLAARNLPTVQVEPADSVNTYELLKFEKIVVTKAAFDKLTARVSKS
jgi:large subunit ribosomal protein L4